jgi:hypothetical protein
MKPLEEELKSALRRISPPEGFAERVVARAGREAARKPRPLSGLRGLFRLRALRWAVAASFAALLIAWGGVHYRQQQRARAEARLARDQARTALHIASAKLNAVLRDAARPESRGFKNPE